MKLKEYIQGNRKGKDAHRVEHEALKDPFLYEALEGFDAIPGNHAERIGQLQEQLAEAVRPKRRLWLRWSAVASFLLLVSLGGYFLFTDMGKVPETLLSYGHELPVVPSKKVVETPLVELIEQPKPVVERRPKVQQAKQATMLAENRIIEEDTFSIELKEEIQGIAFASRKEVAGIDSGMVYIKGRITDEYGGPIFGATIAQKDTSTGTISDIFGSMDIALHEDKVTLDEVVVTGAYRSQRKKEMAGDMSKIASVKPNSKSVPVIGEKAYKQYVKENILSLTDDEGKKVKGKVKLLFNVNEQGRPIGITVTESLNEAADAEAIRLIKEGSDWTPSEKWAEWTITF